MGAMTAELITALPHALAHLATITADIDGRRPAVFLDYDGTLTSIVDDPAEAVLSEAGRRAISRLARLCTVAVISGRDLADVREMIGIDDLVVAGSHGFDIAGPGWTHQHEVGSGALPALAAAADEIERELGSVAGALVERKQFAVTVHFRRVDPAEHARFDDVVERVAHAHPELRRTGGKMIHELRPDIEWDKGRALRFLLDQLRLDTSDTIPIYLGDDETDEDALAAVAADGIGIVVGADDRPTAASFRVDDPGEAIALLGELADVLEDRRHTDPWRLTYSGFDLADEGLREALTTLGNGYVATRGALPEVHADDHVYPGTYLAGVFNRLTSEVGDRQVENEDMVNAPNWLSLTWRPVGSEWFDLRHVEVLDHRIEVDLRHGVHIRHSRVRDGDGRTTSITQRRIVSMDDPHLAALETTLIAEDWSGPVEVRSMLDGRVTNSGVARYRTLANRHLRPRWAGRLDDDSIALEVETTWSEVRIAQAARTTVTSEVVRRDGLIERRTAAADDMVADLITFEIRASEPATIEKVVAIHTSRDNAVGSLLDDAITRVRCAGSFVDLLGPHSVSWEHIWNRCHVGVDVDDATALALNLHVFHLAQTVSKHSAEIDAGVPARGLHGEAYRGHIFWDELFILPFLSLRLPGLTRGHLMYRYRRLGAARRAAIEAGYRGAMYPWQSGSTGREETQTVHLNPASGRWLSDGSHLQRHINAAVVYDLWHYHEATGDLDFLAFHGAEMVCEIARFWASIAQFDPQLERYRIRGVMGPDEYHERYPDASEPGLDDNAYTNVMAVWCLERALAALREVAPRRETELRERLDITDAEIERWRDITRRMRVCFHDGVISQFDGYGDLEEFDWNGYRRRYGDIARLDRILEAEGKSTNSYKLSKQADVLMLFYLLSVDEVTRIFTNLGYDLDADVIHRTVEYYQARTSHGSTLSKVVEAWVLARSDRPRSWNTFQHALRSDLYDVQGGTTAEGVHLGAMAGTVDLIQRCYTGIEARDGALWLDPNLPAELRRLKLDIRYRRRWLILEFSDHLVDVEVRPSALGPIRINIAGQSHELHPGERRRFAG
jgi:alpha,alpha-trehalase